MSKKHLALIMLMSFIGGLAGSFILNTLRPIDAIAKQQQKEISVNKIKFYDEAGILRGEISGYDGGLSFGTSKNEKSGKQVWLELNSIAGDISIGETSKTGVREINLLR